MNRLQHFSALAIILFTAVPGAAGEYECTLNNQNISNLATFTRDNGCSRSQCQFGQIVPYYNACGKEVDGSCHKPNEIFEFKGIAYQCRDTGVDGPSRYKYEIPGPRSASCTYNGTTYEQFQKVTIDCRENQCQNGKLVALDARCDSSVDGKCHLVDERFESNGVVYTCTNKTDATGTTGFQNVVLDPQPAGKQSCKTNQGRFDNLKIFTLPPVCNLRQCQDGTINILTNACAFKKANACYQLHEQWTDGSDTFECRVNQTTGQARTEIIKRYDKKCVSGNVTQQHLETRQSPNVCSVVQCQNGVYVPITRRCVSSDAKQCNDVNYVWFGDSKYLKCVFENGEYKNIEVNPPA